jgi:hypothetical protein
VSMQLGEAVRSVVTATAKAASRDACAHARMIRPGQITGPLTHAGARCRSSPNKVFFRHFLF